jgi:hypothetical protein
MVRRWQAKSGGHLPCLEYGPSSAQVELFSFSELKQLSLTVAPSPEKSTIARANLGGPCSVCDSEPGGTHLSNLLRLHRRLLDQNKKGRDMSHSSGRMPQTFGKMP